MSAPLHREKFRKPELFFSELLKKGAQGTFAERDDNLRVFYRALVVAVDVHGGRLENETGTGKVTHVINGHSFDSVATLGPSNPRNSVKARLMTDGFDQFIGDDRLRVFWPFFPEHLAIPVKPGEHVYVLFEDENFQHGLWFSKVSGHEGLNRFVGESAYTKSSQGGVSDLFPGSDVSSSSEELNTDLEAGEVLASGNRLSSLFGE